jgi:hypothetical protein
VPYTGFAYDVPKLDQVKKVGADYNQHGLELVMAGSKLAGNIVEQWHISTAPGSAPSSSRSPSSTARTWSQRFREAGVAAEHLDGTTPTSEREGILARLKQGRTQVVCNVNVLTEGWDCPSSRCACSRGRRSRRAVPADGRPGDAPGAGQGHRAHPRPRELHPAPRRARRGAGLLAADRPREVRPAEAAAHQDVQGVLRHLLRGRARLPGVRARERVGGAADQAR